VFFPVGAYTVIVGWLTWLMAIHGLPATGSVTISVISGFVARRASGAVPGQIGT
jgi:hypothetical protein